MGGLSDISHNCNPHIGPDCGAPGIYGTLGVPSSANIPGGRSSASAWTDQDGNFWLFGGSGFDANGAKDHNEAISCALQGGTCLLNDIWEFNPLTLQWAWMGGSNIVGLNYPAETGVYGTLGIPAPENVPGGRSGASGWADHNGNLWLYGGFGYDSTSAGGGKRLSDLWKFQISSGDWMWMSGTNTVGSSGLMPSVYGSLGIPDAANTPGSRVNSNAWFDPDGNLWLYGGYGLDLTGYLGDPNDLWEYRLSTAAAATATPIFNPGAGTYGTPRSVSISDTTPGAAIY